MIERQETILSIVYENRALRWVLVVFGFVIAVLATVIAVRPPSPVWVVTENGDIFRGDRHILSWEPGETVRRCFEILLIPTDNREALIKAYFSDELQSNILASRPTDRFISFQLKSQKEEKKGTFVLTGVLFRVEKPAAEVNVTLVRTQRSELNPFGLVVVKTEISEKAKE